MSNEIHLKEEALLRRQVDILQRQLDEIRELVPASGFVTAWFREVPNHENGLAAFETLNERYRAYFKEDRYTYV